MGMFSEADAERSAQKYEKILLAAIDMIEDDYCDPQDSNAVMNFCHEHIYPNYSDELGEAWRSKKTEEQIKIEKYFDNL